jgi:hypothetical protein
MSSTSTILAHLFARFMDQTIIITVVAFISQPSLSVKISVL